MTTLADRDEVARVLKYWLAAIQAEASISARPRAHRRGGPAGAQAYLRLTAEHAELFVNGTGSVALPIGDAERRFLEHWTRIERRRERLAREGSAPAWSIGWPTFYFERREELATLIRAPIDLEWSRADVRRPPHALVLKADAIEREVAVDRDLLANVVGLLDEELAALDRRIGSAPSAEHVARAVLAALDVETKASDPHELLDALVRALAPRLPPGVSVWPTALVQDPGLFHATYHLQNELGSLIGSGDRPTRLSTTDVLWSYLAGRKRKPKHEPMLGRFRPRGLTASQRAAGEQFLGSKLTAVQGPPGTGKTELILSLAAHTIVERVADLAENGTMLSEQLVVASTNNRAVDNVLDPLDADPGRLPIALRAGNQEVTTSTTVATLRRAEQWLLAQPEIDAKAALDEALTRFREAHEAVRRIVDPPAERRRRRERIAELEAHLERVRREAEAEPAQLFAAVETIERGVRRMLRVVQARKGKRKLARVTKCWSELVEELPVLANVDSPIARALRLPPEIPDGTDDAEAIELWEDALEDAAEAIAETQKNAPKRTSPKVVRQWEAQLEELRAAVEAQVEVDTDPAEVEAVAHELFLRALDVRERWAVVHRTSLLEAITYSIDRIEETRSLRRGIGRRSDASLALRRLYPIVGSTLLSLGNVFDAASDVIDRLVIDEAGQCHPAYAVSGLMRASRALVIGDVHQLPPVFRLSERDDERVQRTARVDLSGERFAPFRVHEQAKTSAQRLADRAVEVRPTLIDHFRCHPEIIAVSDALANYGLTVHTPPRAAMSPLSGAVLFADAAGQQVRVRGSWTNVVEAEAVLEMLADLVSAGVPHEAIGIITPFVAQEQMIRAELARRRLSSPHLAVGTVHRFQGGERSIVLFTSVVTQARSLAFVDDHPNLLNVAVSRAREHLVTFGHAETLRIGRHTRLLVERGVPLRLGSSAVPGPFA